jgi:hypothetical protein
MTLLIITITGLIIAAHTMERTAEQEARCIIDAAAEVEVEQEIDAAIAELFAA